MSCHFNAQISLGSLAIEAAAGYVGAALFTNINPLIGVGFGCLSSVISTVAKGILDKFAHDMNPNIKNVISTVAGVAGAAVAIGILAGTTITAGAALGLFLSILAAKVIFALAGCCCCFAVANANANEYVEANENANQQRVNPGMFSHH